MQTGQLNIDSNAGKVIYQVSKTPWLRTVVDVGTWNGLGSTLCIARALSERQLSESSKGYTDRETFFVSIEINYDQYIQSRVNLRDFIDRGIVKLLHGRLIDYGDVFWFDHDTIDFSCDLHARLYYQSDLEQLKTSPKVSCYIPSIIDFLVLDGGEYSSFPEFLVYRDRANIIFLDDVKTLKNRCVRNMLLSDNNFKLIVEDLGERNGFSLFQRKTLL